MPIIRNFCFCNDFSLKKTIILNIVVVLVLVSVTLWDTANIINDYIYDNRYTLVKVEYVNDTFSFLENTRLKIVFDYKETIFRELWTNDTVVKETPDLLDLEGAGKKFTTNIAYDKEINVSAMSLNDQITIAMTLQAVQQLDNICILCAIRASNESCALITKFAYLDGVLENGSFLEAIQTNLWSIVQPNIIRLIPNSNTVLFPGLTEIILPELLQVVLGHWRVYVDIPLSVILKENHPFVQYAIGVVGDFDWTYKQSTTVPIFGLFSANYMPPAVLLPQKVATIISLTIDNIGIYDKRLTTKCEEEPEMLFLTGPSTDECTPREYLKTIFSTCNCTPLLSTRISTSSQKY